MKYIPANLVFKPEDTKSPRVQALFEHILLQDVMLNHHRLSD